MATPLGKALRRLRVDADERGHDMAARLGISSAFLSAVELGRKAPPRDFADKVRAAYPSANAEEMALLAALARPDFLAGWCAAMEIAAREAGRWPAGAPIATAIRALRPGAAP